MRKLQKESYLGGQSIRKEAETILFLYGVLHFFTTIGFAFLMSMEEKENYFGDIIVERNWWIFIAVCAVGLASLLSIYTFTNLQIQLYGNIVYQRMLIENYLDQKIDLYNKQEEVGSVGKGDQKGIDIKGLLDIAEKRN